MALIASESNPLVEIVDSCGELINLDGPEVFIRKDLGEASITFKPSDNHNGPLPRSDREAVLRLTHDPRYEGTNAFRVMQPFTSDSRGIQTGKVKLYVVHEFPRQTSTKVVESYNAGQPDSRNPHI